MAMMPGQSSAVTRTWGECCANAMLQTPEPAARSSTDTSESVFGGSSALASACAGVVDRKNILDEPLEESDAILLSINAMRRSSGPHNLVELLPQRKHCFAYQQKKRAMKSGFSA